MSTIKPLDTHQLYDILSRDPYVSPHFGGVYPRDALPIVSEGRSFVINTDRADKPGEHWVCVYFGDDGIAEYFDSYGLPPWVYGDIVRFMRSKSRSIVYNTVPYQSLDTPVCGHYCIYYLHHRSRKVPRSDMMRWLMSYHLPIPSKTWTKEDNDRFIYQWYRENVNPRKPRALTMKKQTCVCRKVSDHVPPSVASVWT